jgi:succinyl-CoA synthetase alpha subunit
MIDPRQFAAWPAIIQGITGKSARQHLPNMLKYGSRIAGGVSPKAAEVGQIDGVPVFASCGEAVRRTGAKVSVLFVPPMQVLQAVEEALEAGIRCLVTPTEGVPVHDAMRARRLVRAADALWVGACTPGMAVPGLTSLGFLPAVALRPGSMGLMSKSGTLSYETGYRIARSGIGQSVWVGVGGDPVKGTRFGDLVPFYARDMQTRALAIVGEIGGNEEEEFAERLKAERFAKPVFALIAGLTAPQGVTMGHAGAMFYGRIGSAASKREALQSAGVRVFDSLRAFEIALRDAAASGFVVRSVAA